MKITQGEITIDYEGNEIIGVSIDGEEAKISIHDFKAMANAAYDAWLIGTNMKQVLDKTYQLKTYPNSGDGMYRSTLDFRFSRI